MVETLHPDVYVIEEGSAPTIVGVGTGTGGFIIEAQKGPIDDALFITSWEQFSERYGGYYQGKLGPINVKAFFDEGGTRCFVGRVVGSGSAVASGNVAAQALAPSFGTVLSGNSEPYNLEPGELINVNIDAAPQGPFTFTAVEARMVGAAPPVPGAPATWLDIQFSGNDIRRVTFTGAEVTPADIAATINTFITDGACQVIGGLTLDLVSDQRGSGASATIVAESVPGLAIALGFIVGTVFGTGNVADIEEVTATEVVGVLSTLAGATASVESGKVRITTATVGLLGDVQVLVSTTATAIGFDNLVHAGVNGVVQNSGVFQTQTPGAWGNQVQYDTTVWSTTTTAIFNDGGTVTTLNNVTLMREGDIVKLYNPADGNVGYGVVHSIVTALKQVTFMAPVTLSIPGSPMPVGTEASSSTYHRQVTSTVGALATGGTEVELTTLAGVNIGSHVIIGDGTTMVDVIVTAKSGNIIRFAAVTLGSTIAAGAVASTIEFAMKVYQEGDLLAQYVGLSMEPTNDVDYVGKRLYGDGNESNDVEFVDGGLTPTPLWMRQPDPVLAFISGASDGAAPTDNDWKGSSSAPKSGLYLFDAWLDIINMISTPGVTSVSVTGNGMDYTEAKEDLEYIAFTPLADDEAQEAYDYRMRQLNKDTMFGVLYYPWGIIDDPEIDGQDLRTSLEGWVQGEWADTAANIGVHKNPANVTIRGVKDLTHYTSDGEQDLLNPVGVNVITAKPGEGIRIMGGRTLWSTQDGRHYISVRRLLDFIKRSMRLGNRWAVQAVNDPSLWKKLVNANGSFLRGLWQSGMLFPSNDVTKAFFVKCDGENNPQDQRKLGRVWVYAGVNPPYPAEFVIIKISQWDGGSSAEETLGGTP